MISYCTQDISSFSFAAAVSAAVVAASPTVIHVGCEIMAEQNCFRPFSEINAPTATVFNTLQPFIMESSPVSVKKAIPEPRTELARIMLDHRKKILSQGVPLLSADEINLLVREVRGSV